MEPPQNEKYLLWADILSENGKCPVRFRINSARCRYTVISMNNAPVKESHGRFEKDKSSEKTGSGTLVLNVGGEGAYDTITLTGASTVSASTLSAYVAKCEQWLEDRSSTATAPAIFFF